jgi:hypothetical protein
VNRNIHMYKLVNRNIHRYKLVNRNMHMHKLVNRNIHMYVLGHIYSNVQSRPGATPTIVSNDASAVKMYNATISLVRFEKKNILQ